VITLWLLLVLLSVEYVVTVATYGETALTVLLEQESNGLYWIGSFSRESKALLQPNCYQLGCVRILYMFYVR
jgi:hypothetical protein